MMTIIAIVSLIIFLKIGTYVGMKLGLKTHTEELLLIPWR